MKISIKTPVLSAVAFFGTLGVLSVGYSAYVSSYPATATAGVTALSAGEWNKMVSALQTLDGKLSTFNITAGGMVGIGTANPGAKLEIVSNAAIPDHDLMIRNGLKWVSFSQVGSGSYNPTTGIWQGIFFSNDTDVSTPTNGFTIAPWSSTAGGIRILENGNVGIGTPSPQAALDVNGKIKMQVDATANVSTADTVPESYKFSRADCNSTTRWSMFVGRFTWDAGQDGLCVCMDVNAVMEWVCFNP